MAGGLCILKGFVPRGIRVLILEGGDKVQRRRCVGWNLICTCSHHGLGDLSKLDVL